MLMRPETATASLHWYALVVAGGTEFLVLELLRRRGIASACPSFMLRRLPHRRARKKVEMHFPIYANYVFIGFPPLGPQPWYQLAKVSFIQAVVGWEGEPARMNARQVAKCIDRFGDGSEAMPSLVGARADRERRFKVGDSGDITRGPFQGHTVKVASIRGKMAQALLPLFGRESLINVPLANLD